MLKTNCSPHHKNIRAIQSCYTKHADIVNELCDLMCFTIEGFYCNAFGLNGIKQSRHDNFRHSLVPNVCP